jgi:hypothetical protein
MLSRNLKIAACLAVLLAGGTTAFAGRIPDPAIDVETVDAYCSRTYYIDYYGGIKAEVGVIGDGDTDLDVKVYDEWGRLVAQDLSYSDRCYCDWYPSRRGTYRIVVENLGNVWNRYTLITN